MYSYILATALSLEAAAYPKPGNVHRVGDLPGLKFEDFILTTGVTSKWFLKGFRRGMRGWGKTVFGDIVYGVISDIYKLTSGSNPCLGSTILLAPLSISIGKCVDMDREELKCFINGVEEVLNATTVYDSIYFYRAVRLVKPSYIRREDYTGEYVNIWSRKYVKELVEKNQRLIDILKYSSRKDIVADELLNKYPRSRDAVEFLKNRLAEHGDWNRAVVETHIYLLSKHLDTLVVRKHGHRRAEHVRKISSETLDRMLDDRGEAHQWFIEAFDLDKHLRRYGVNPGSIADLVVATIAIYMLERYVERKPLFSAKAD